MHALNLLLNNLYTLSIGKISTDVEIVLDDNKQQISIHVHRYVLASGSNYFLRLFTLGSNIHKNKFTLKVGNIEIVKDLVYGFYGQKIKNINSDYLFKMFKCRDYFHSTGDVKILHDLGICSDEFYLFLDAFENFDLGSGNNNDSLVEKIDKKMNLRIVSTSSDKTIKIWDALTGQLVNTLTGHHRSVMSVAFSSDNSKIVSGSSDETVKIWDALSGKLINTLTGHHDWVRSVAFSPDNSKIVSGSDDKTVKIWDALSGQLINTLTGHSGFIWSVAFSPDSSKIVTRNCDNIVKIWDALTGHHDSVVSVVINN